jgi:hypothetical protein
VWWHKAVIPALRRPRQEGHKFKVSLGYTAISYLKIRDKKTKQKTKKSPKYVFKVILYNYQA